MANFYKKLQSRKDKKQNQLGRSMIEMLGVLAIIGVLSVGGIAGYSKAMNKWKLQKAFDQISTIVTNMYTLMGNVNAADQENLNSELAIKLGIIPDEMVQDNPYGYSITNVYKLPVNINGGFYLLFSYAVPSSEACVAIATANIFDVNVLDSMDITDEDAGIDWEITRDRLPMTLEEAGKACKWIDKSDKYGWVHFYFKSQL